MKKFCKIITLCYFLTVSSLNFARVLPPVLVSFAKITSLQELAAMLQSEGYLIKELNNGTLVATRQSKSEKRQKQKMCEYCQPSSFVKFALLPEGYFVQTNKSLEVKKFYQQYQNDPSYVSRGSSVDHYVKSEIVDNFQEAVAIVQRFVLFGEDAYKNDIFSNRDSCRVVKKIMELMRIKNAQDKAMYESFKSFLKEKSEKSNNYQDHFAEDEDSVDDDEI